NDFWLFDVDNTAVDSAFLNEYIGTADFVDRCLRASEGTTNRVRLQPGRFLSLAIPLPPVPEQRRSVARVGGIRERIAKALELNEQLDAALDALVVSLHVAAASGDEPAMKELLILDEDRTPVRMG